MAISDRLEQIITTLNKYNKTKIPISGLSIEDRVDIISEQLNGLINIATFGAYPVDSANGSDTLQITDAAGDLPVKDLIVGPIESSVDDDGAPIALTEASVNVNDDVKTISWEGITSSCYRGTVNFATGVLTIDRGIFDLGDMNWEWDETNSAYKINYNDYNPKPFKADTILCGALPYVARSDFNAATIGITISNSASTVFAKDGVHTGADELTAFIDSLNGVKAAFYLNILDTHQLKPIDIRMLQGSNTITTADDVDIEINYYADPTAYINKKIEEAVNA